MTDEELAEIEKRCNAATPGPWIVTRAGEVDTADGEISVFYAHDLAVFESGDLEFTAGARTDVPALIAEIRRLRNDRDLYKSRFEDICHWAKTVVPRDQIEVIDCALSISNDDVRLMRKDCGLTTSEIFDRLYGLADRDLGDEDE